MLFRSALDDEDEDLAELAWKGLCSITGRDEPRESPAWREQLN